MIEVKEVYEQHLKGLTAREIWQQPIKEKTLAAVMIKLGHPLEKSGCLLCISDALNALHENLAKMPTKNKYRLKAVTIGKLGYPLSNDNLTDELARQLLRRWPGQIKNFFIYPKDWEEDILEKPKVEEEVISLETEKPKAKKTTRKRTVKLDTENPN